VPIHEKLGKRARKAGLRLPATAIAGLEAYFDLLRKWNQKVSLTSLPVGSEGEEALDRLLIEPALAAQYLPNPAATVIDIGSGGGSPAIPMKLVSPGISLRMVESKTRKAAFLREAVRRLDLTGTTVEASRFEALLIRPEFHEAADVVTIRAVRVERNLLTGIQAFLRSGGLLFLFRGGDASNDAALGTDLLQWEASYTLLPHLQSRLVIFRNVPRGTTRPELIVENAQQSKVSSGKATNIHVLGRKTNKVSHSI
jgi:16S rRNA (guanine527-N7)-methyltransferase